MKELIATFVAESRALGQTCGFSKSLEVMIHNHLMCSIKDKLHPATTAIREGDETRFKMNSGAHEHR